MNSGSASSSPARPTTAGSGAGNADGAPAAAEEFHFPSELMSVHDRKDQALHVLKSDLMDSLNKEVKSLDVDNWMFEGPRSRIHLMSRPGKLCRLKAGLRVPWMLVTTCFSDRMLMPCIIGCISCC